MALAASVSRENFHYNGSLFVEVGTLNRHKRATVEELNAILRPDVKKSNKAPLSPPKDQVGHWYEAQLIHYGLPPSKDKARAKMRLLEALNYSKLAVPPHITKMEAELKKEYAAAERKAKAQYKASQAPAKQGKPLTVDKKRKQPQPSGNINNINVNISLGNNFHQQADDFDTTNGQLPAKKAKTGPPKRINKSTPLEIKQPLPEAQTVHKWPRQTAKSAKLSEAWNKDPSIGPGPVNPAGFRYSATPLSRFSLTEGDLPISSNTNTAPTKKKAPIGKEPVLKKTSRAKLEVKAEGKAQISKKIGGKETNVKKDAKIKKEPSAKASSKIKDEVDADPPHSINSPTLGLINGIYDISCPTVESEWSCNDLTVTLSLEGTTVWGAYDLGMFSGILFLPDRPWQTSNEPLPFTWRGRENGEGEMSFGNNCKGEMYFSGNGNISGWINVYGQCCFTGTRRPEAGTAVRPARIMRAEWEGYDEQAYEEESRARW